MKYLKTFESFSPINEEEEFFKTLGQKVASAFGVYNEETRRQAEEIMADYVNDEPLGPDATEDEKTDYIQKSNPKVMANRKKTFDQFNAFKKAYDSKSGLKDMTGEGKVDNSDLQMALKNGNKDVVDALKNLRNNNSSKFTSSSVFTVTDIKSF
jgi:hypothetical protein